MTDTSHDETVDYETHVDLVAEHAATEYRLRLAQKSVQALEIDADSLRDDLCETVGALAEANSVCDRRDAEIASLRKELADMTAVAQELDASSKRMQERAEVAERRLQQQNNGEEDEVIAGLRELLTQERNTVCQRDQQLKDACAKAEELRGRAQKAEAEASGLRNKLKRAEEQAASNTAATAGYREANGEMDRIMRQQEDRIRHLERVIDGLRAEVSHSTTEACDASA